MATFTIDSENNIAARAAVRANLENTQAFESEKELAKLAAEWPGSRLAETLNSFAGVATFTELKPVKRSSGTANPPPRESGRRSNVFRRTVRHRRRRAGSSAVEEAPDQADQPLPGAKGHRPWRRAQEQEGGGEFPE